MLIGMTTTAAVRQLRPLQEGGYQQPFNARLVICRQHSADTQLRKQMCGENHI